MRTNWLCLLLLLPGFTAQAQTFVTPRIWLGLRVSVDWPDEHLRYAETNCQSRPAYLRWARQPERNGVRHIHRTPSGKPRDGELRGEIGLFHHLEAAGYFRGLPEFQWNPLGRCCQRAIQTDRSGRCATRHHEENIRCVFRGESDEKLLLHGLRPHDTDATRRGLAHRVRQGDTRYRP